MNSTAQFNKIFGIGLSRTGTTSLSIAMLYLGFRTAHYVTNQESYRRAQALTDSPVFVDFKILDRQYPQSRFIYTDRDPQPWLKSFRDKLLDGPMNQREIIKAPRNRADMMNQRVYQELFRTTESLTDDVLLDGFSRHRQQVLEHFADRPDDLLVLRIGEDDNATVWDRLTEFLGVRVPGTFPIFANQRAILWEQIRHPCKVG